MDTLTLARYYCEMSLMDMELVPERGSLLASACLLMALLTKDLGGWVSATSCRPLLPPGGRKRQRLQAQLKPSCSSEEQRLPLTPQTPILQFHSGYQKSDLAPVTRKLHAALSAPPDDKLKAIRNKYSHK